MCQVRTFECSIGDSSTPTPPSHIISSTSSLVALSLDRGNPRMAPQIWESYRAPLSIQLVADRVVVMMMLLMMVTIRTMVLVLMMRMMTMVMVMVV